MGDILKAIVPLIRAKRKADFEAIGYTGLREAILGDGATPNIVVVPPAQAEFKGAMWVRTVDTQDNTTQLIQVAQHWSGVKYDNSGGGTPVTIGYPPNSKNLSLVGPATTITQGAGYGGMLPSQYADYLNNAPTMNRLLDLRLRAAGGLKVKIGTGHFIRDGVLNFYKHDQTLDLTAEVPATTNFMKWVLVYLDNTNTLQYLDGTEFDLGQLVPVDQGCATTLNAADDIVVGAVRLYEGQTEIKEREDIYPLPHLVSVASSSTATVDPAIMRGRLTAESGDAYYNANKLSVTTLYYAPIGNGTITLWNTVSSEWENHTLSEISIAVPATTDTLYDVFVYDNSGTKTLELVAWTNDTTRATALDTQNGYEVQTGAKNKRWIGLMRTTAVSGESESSASHTGGEISTELDGKRYIVNAYNQIPLRMFLHDQTTSWTTTSTSFQNLRGQATNRNSFCYIDRGMPVFYKAEWNLKNSTNNAYVGIGLDNSTAHSGDSFTGGGESDAFIVPAQATYNAQPSEGAHYLQVIQKVQGGTGTFYGIAAAGPLLKSAASGWVWG